MEFIDIPTEQTTAVTDLMMGILAIIIAINLYRVGGLELRLENTDPGAGIDQNGRSTRRGHPRVYEAFVEGTGDALQAGRECDIGMVAGMSGEGVRVEVKMGRQATGEFGGEPAAAEGQHIARVRCQPTS